MTAVTPDQRRLHTAAAALLAELNEVFPSPDPTWEVGVWDEEYKEFKALLSEGDGKWWCLTDRLPSSGAAPLLRHKQRLAALGDVLRGCQREADQASGPGAEEYRVLLARLAAERWARWFEEPDHPLTIDDSLYYPFQVGVSSPNPHLVASMLDAAKTLPVLPAAPTSCGSTPDHVDYYISENEKFKKAGFTDHSERATKEVNKRFKTRSGGEFTKDTLRSLANRRQKQRAATAGQ